MNDTARVLTVAPEAEVRPTVIGAAQSILEIISRAATDPSFDVDKVERLMQMYERQKAQQAKTSYMAALSELQSDLPVVERKGRIVIREKDGAGKRSGEISQSTPYALWEDINEAIKPHLKTHGFALSFRVARDGDRVMVTGILSHRDGHSEETTLPAPLDTTGSKNNVQAVGSSLSYGKRYTAAALLNLTSRGEDDDGKKAGDDGALTDEQADAITKLAAEVGADIGKFLIYMKAESISGIPGKKFDDAVAALEKRRKAKS